MTSSTVPVDLDDANPDEAPRPRGTGARPAALDPDRGWAVVEIRGDGTLGHLELVTAAGVVEAARAARRAERTRAATQVIDPELEVHLGQLQAAHGQLRESATSFRRGLSAATTTAQRGCCLDHLALVEAYRGQLRSSATHESQATPLRAAAGTPGQLARAWRHLEQGELTDAERCLDRVDPAPDPRDQPWLATIRTLLVAELLMASGRPEAAARLLCDVPSAGDAAPAPAWSTGVLAVARAEALLAEGETQRALAAITPLPPRTAVEASVTAAAVRMTIGDLRGAQAVLDAVVDRLDLAPLGLQVRAWLLEGRLAQHRGRHERSRLLVERALQAAAAEGMRNAVRRDWMWLRALADRDPVLLRGHRELLTNLAGLDAVARSGALGGSAPPGAPGGPMGSALTAREAQVLELLAQMYSTEEIAAALYVSGNTVKTHLKGIFGKLCVNRRVDAVRRGRQLGLC